MVEGTGIMKLVHFWEYYVRLHICITTGVHEVMVNGAKIYSVAANVRYNSGQI